MSEDKVKEKLLKAEVGNLQVQVADYRQIIKELKICLDGALKLILKRV